MFCKQCGKEIGSEAKFCQYCGDSVEPIEPSAPKESDKARAESFPKRLVPDQGQAKETRSSATRQLILGTMILAIALTAFFHFFRLETQKRSVYSPNLYKIGSTREYYAPGEYRIKSRSRYYKNGSIISKEQADDEILTLAEASERWQEIKDASEIGNGIGAERYLEREGHVWSEAEKTKNYNGWLTLNSYRGLGVDKRSPVLKSNNPAYQSSFLGRTVVLSLAILIIGALLLYVTRDSTK